MSDPVSRLNASLEGRYAIERELGEGGMATVYLADDLKHHRSVALKVLKPELAALVGAERFLAEIETTANLTHPHILPLFDSGEADGFLFYVMPYLEGETPGRRTAVSGNDRPSGAGQDRRGQARIRAGASLVGPGERRRSYPLRDREAAGGSLRLGPGIRKGAGGSRVPARGIGRCGLDAFRRCVESGERRDDRACDHRHSRHGVVPPEPDRFATRFTVKAPPGLGASAAAGVAISPDERTVVFGNAAPPLNLFLRDLDRLETVPLPGTEDYFMPFFSPDGAWIGFIDAGDNTLKRIRIDGSDLQTLGPAPATGRSAGWGEDGTIVFNSSGLGGLSRISETGGEPELIAREAGSILWLDLPPGGQAVLGKTTASLTGPVAAVALGTGEEKVILPGPVGSARYVATGHVVYWREGALWVVPSDVDRLEITGPPTLVAQGVGAGRNGFASFAVSENILIYEAGGLAGLTTGVPVWVDREGNQEPLPVDPGQYAWPRISPDGTKVALARLQDNYDIWIHDVTSGVSTQLTFDPAEDYSPIWTPDTAHVVFRSCRDGPCNLYRRRADGTDEVERLTTSAADQRPSGFTPDGLLLFAQVDSATGSDVWSMAMEAGATPVPLMQEAFSETQLSISPAGGFMAYESSELGYPEIFVRSFPDLRGRRMLSTLDIGPMSGIRNSDPREARSPVWSRDGSEIFYRSGNAVLRVPVGSEDTFPRGHPRSSSKAYGLILRGDVSMTCRATASDF